MQLHDTIVAISSPPGPAARGIVRLSGPDAHRLASVVFSTLDRPQSLPGAVDGLIRLESGTLPATAWIFAAPKSYTRQNMVELHALGSPGLLGLIVEALIAAGARRAEAGEFTARAYLNGALDLAQVQGVAALISAQSEGQRRAATRLLEGSLSKTAHAAREELADLLSLVEGALDFADEPIEFITPVDLRHRLGLVAALLQETLDVSQRTERWDRSPHVLLAGLPNAGKSSLLNRLTGRDRAIATPIAGTTRDTIATDVYIKEYGRLILIDSAGLTSGEFQFDLVEQLADNATRVAAADADFILWVIDVSLSVANWPDQNRALDGLRQGLEHHEPGSRPAGVLLVLNKSDIATNDRIRQWTDVIRANWHHQPAIVSATTGSSCDDLKLRLGEILAAQVERNDQSPIAIAGEHHDALQRALEALARALSLPQVGHESLSNADLVALELHAAADALGILVGRDVPDDLLGRVFARFCVGK